MTLADKLLVALAVFALAGLYQQLWTPGAPAQVAHIHVDGKRVQTVALNAEREIRIEGPHGDSVLEIRPGAIRFVQSPCTGKYCVQSGWQDHGGALAACLPNHVTVQVAGGTERFDAVVF